MKYIFRAKTIAINIIMQNCTHDEKYCFNKKAHPIIYYMKLFRASKHSNSNDESLNF